MLGNRYVAGLVGILFLLIIAYNIHFFTSRTGHEKTAAASVGQERTLEQPVHRVMEIPERVIVQSDADRWKRDPFSLIKNIKTPKGTEAIVITGILKRDGMSRALINGAVYTVHDRIGTSVITDIKKHSIVVMKDGRSREISVDDYIVWEE